MNTHADKFRDAKPPEEATLDLSGEFGPEFERELRNLRSAVHQAADHEMTKPIGFDWLMPAKRRQRSARRRLVLAWTCAALLCLGVVPFLRQSAPVATDKGPTVAQRQATEADDTALLEQVDTAVTESVPSSLAPLATLDDWSSTTPTSAEPTLNKPEKKNVTQ